MRIRPTDIKKVVKLLDSPADSVEDLARSVIELIIELQEDRELWVLFMRDPKTGDFIFGPYDSLNDLKKDIGKGIIASTPEVKAGAFKLIRT